MFPGISETVLSAIFGIPGLKGVLETYGSECTYWGLVHGFISKSNK
jgi:hypothetical protein